MTDVIYGVDITQPVTAVMTRDAIVRCFKAAHQEVLDLDDELMEWRSDTERENFRNMKVELTVHAAFEKMGVDYEKPTKEGLLKVVDSLAQMATAFRQPDIVAKHVSEINGLVDKIET